MLVTDRAGVLPKRSPTGEYDREILCKGCEPGFSDWDTYGKTVLLDMFSKSEEIHEGGELAAYRLRGVDIPKLRMFFISVLWRASISSRDYYRGINLGPFEAIAKARITARAPNADINDFSVILSKWDKDWIPVMSNPYMIKMAGVNVAVFEIADYKAYVKVDKRPLPDNMDRFALGSEAGVIFLARNFGDSRERKVLLKLAPKFYR